MKKFLDMDGTIADFESAMREDLTKISKNKDEIPKILHLKRSLIYMVFIKLL